MADQDDFTIEPNESEPGSEPSVDDELTAPAAALKKLREQLKTCQAERQEYLETSQRLKADYVNYKREEAANRAELANYAKADLLLQLLELADNFELAFANRTAWEAVEVNWRRGVEYIYAKLQTIFTQNGLEAIAKIGVAFDPNLHQAVATIPVTLDQDDNMVMEIVHQGYRLNGKVIRPAQVKVGQIMSDKSK